MFGRRKTDSIEPCLAHGGDMWAMRINKNSEGFPWREPDLKSEPYGYPFHKCSYDGSIHPKELIAFLNDGCRLELSDMKYGYPHKYYVEGIPNPQAGKEVAMGWEWKGGVKKAIKGTASKTSHAKFYTIHLLTLSDEDFESLNRLLWRDSRVKFVRRDGSLLWYRPEHYDDAPLER